MNTVNHLVANEPHIFLLARPKLRLTQRGLKMPVSAKERGVKVAAKARSRQLRLTRRSVRFLSVSEADRFKESEFQA